MNPVQSKYSNSMRHSDDEDIATLRALVAQLIAEKAQSSSDLQRMNRHFDQLKS